MLQQLTHQVSLLGDTLERKVFHQSKDHRKNQTKYPIFYPNNYCFTEGVCMSWVE
jgi:hypothetical protein